MSFNQINLELDFLESIQGCKKNVTYEKIDVCNTCRGSRTKPGTGPSTCSVCKGNGRIAVRKAPSIWKQNVQHVEERGKSSSILASLIKSEHAEERDLGILQLPKY